MTTRPTLLCTVRACGAPLTRQPGRVVCPNGHSFDVARSGYINLLQPQDRRSRTPGDMPAAIQARRLIHEQGTTQPFVKDIAHLLSASSEDTVLDVGSGEGFYLGTLAAAFGFQANGLDISIKAADAAARRYPDCEWIVANADRFLPYADHSFSRLLSLTARLNAPEFHRVLRPNGKLLLASPAEDDLVELRGSGRDRSDRAIQSLSPQFKVVQKLRSTTSADLSEEQVRAVLLSIYRPAPSSSIAPRHVTFSLDLLLFDRTDS